MDGVRACVRVCAYLRNAEKPCCQGGFYPGTSAKGYAARVTFQRAKEEGMDVAIHWQDADSSSAKAVREIFPEV